jgi:hypothetical protein
MATGMNEYITKSKIISKNPPERVSKETGQEHSEEGGRQTLIPEEVKEHDRDTKVCLLVCDTSNYSIHTIQSSIYPPKKLSPPVALNWNLIPEQNKRKKARE